MDVVPPDREVFRHEALLYEGGADYVPRFAPLIKSAVEADHPALVAARPGALGALRDELGPDSRAVRWIDISGIGRNPARIIPLWREFVRQERARRPDVPLFGIGEPVHVEQDPEETSEAQLHERLLDAAFAQTTGFTLVCPYDTATLAPQVVEEATRVHRWVGGLRHDHAGASADLSHGDAGRRPWTMPSDQVVADLPIGPVRELERGVREAFRSGAWPAVRRRDDLMMAVLALLQNIGPADGSVTLWSKDGFACAELRGVRGLGDPLAGREWPAPPAGPERALWLANQLIDLVQVRGTGDSAVVRLRQGAG